MSFVQKMKLQKRKFFKIFMTMLVSMFFLMGTASAYVDYNTLSVPAYSQEESNWCWAAATEMAANFLGANSTQSYIVTLIYGSPVNETGTIANIQTALLNYNVKSTTLLSNLSFDTIVYEIGRGEPIIAGVTASAGSHAVVIRGYYQDTNASTQNVYYIDPTDASYHIMAYSSFVSNSTFKWNNTVHAIYV
jgi:hypothetical protein